jgi:photosynthetic reaction center cytochrome c subunit
MTRNLLRALAVAGAALVLAACERPPMQSTQSGYRGTGMDQIQNPRLLEARLAAMPPLPVAPPPAPTEGPKARDVFQNVKVLGDLPVAEFTRHMNAITAWVSPAQGCTYCHTANFADDSVYTKVVARRMIEMTRALNGNWQQHVGATGVTCYTCHRGQPVPAQVSVAAAASPRSGPGSMLGNDAGQNKAVPSVAYASLPYDPVTTFLAGADADADPIRVQSQTALPNGNLASIKQTEFTYSLMNHISESLGVNCTFCHNTASFQSWDGPAQRVTAYHGIRMVRGLNSGYLTPLASTFPPERLGPTGDVPKVNCGTCHRGQNKPLGGAAMAHDFSGLTAVSAAAAPASAASAGVADGGAAAATPPPLSEAQRAVLYFAVGSPALEPDQARALDPLIEALKAQPQRAALVSGFHSGAGAAGPNEELAKQRAFAVRNALLAAGLPETRVELSKPQQAQANAAGEDAAARRVEVTLR